jgi:START domain
MANAEPIRLVHRSMAWRLSLGLGALLVLGLSLVPAGHTRSEARAGSWKQVDDDDGIKVWRLEIPGREFPGFRGETVIPASAERIVSVLKRVEQHTQWMHRCSASEIIQRFDDDHVVIYNRTDTPWPVWDRDAILDTFFTRSTDDQLITLTFQNADPTRRTLPENVVRMPRLVGYYKMWRLGPEQTKVVYQVEVDIGGSVPRFIAERVARDMPYETLARLRARVTGAK